VVVRLVNAKLPKWSTLKTHMVNRIPKSAPRVSFVTADLRDAVRQSMVAFNDDDGSALEFRLEPGSLKLSTRSAAGGLASDSSLDVPGYQGESLKVRIDPGRFRSFLRHCDQAEVDVTFAGPGKPVLCRPLESWHYVLQSCVEASSRPSTMPNAR
jgi:DNA polymerase III sliding clamp (beta) subunit (PCNA family)